MFEYLALFSKIFVTGPQRSGTTLVGAAIASDLGYWFYPEEQVRVHEWWRVERLWQRTTNFVLQAPALCRYAHKVSAPNVAVVLVRRNVDDIIASECRINWDSQEWELRRYGLAEGVISQVKYDYWDNHQKHLIENAFEVEYEDLKAHPMWVPKGQRMGWGLRQYKHEEP